MQPDSNQNFFSNFLVKHRATAASSPSSQIFLPLKRPLDDNTTAASSDDELSAAGSGGAHLLTDLSSPPPPGQIDSAPLFPNIVLGSGGSIGGCELPPLQRPIPLLSTFADAAASYHHHHHPHLPAFLRERLRAAAESFHPAAAAFYSPHHHFLHPEAQLSSPPFLSRRLEQQQLQHSPQTLLRLREGVVSCAARPPPAGADRAQSELSESLINKDS